MITVLIRVTHGAEALAATLSALVPAVAAGLVGDAVILADRQDDTLAKVADAVGATLVVAERGSWTAGARVARRDWLLCLDDGDIPQEGWIRVLDRFVALSGPEQGLARMRRRQAGVARALTNLFADVKVRAGDLVHRRVLMNEVRARMPVRLSATIERDPVFG
jgi:glycosyltransferase involved in cell wall biosynthesis